MKKTFRLGCILVLILSVLCACNFEGPKPEDQNQNEQTVPETRLAVSVKPFTGAAKYVIKVTNKDDVTLTDPSVITYFEADEHVNYNVAVFAYAADGKLLATASTRVMNATVGDNAVTMTLSAVTERVLNSIKTNIGVQDFSASVVEDCLVLNNDGTFTRTTTSGKMTLDQSSMGPQGGNGGPSVMEVVPETGNPEEPAGPKFIPEWNALTVTGTYTETADKVVLTFDGKTETLDKDLYETIEGQPLEDVTASAILSLGSITIEKENLDEVAQMAAGMGFGAIPTEGPYAVPDSILSMLDPATLVKINKDLVLDLYFNLFYGKIELIADLHFEGNASDPIISAFGDKLSLRDPLSVKGKVELPVLYEEGKGIVTPDGQVLFPLKLVQKAGNTVTCAEFQVPGMDGQPIDIVIPFRNSDWQPYLSGEKFSTAKSFAPQNFQFEKIMAAAEKILSNDTQAVADFTTYIDKLAAFTWDNQDLTGHYTAEGVEFSFDFARPQSVVIDGVRRYGNFYQNQEGPDGPTNIEMYVYNGETGKRAYKFSVKEFLKANAENPEKITGIKMDIYKVNDKYQDEILLTDVNFVRTERNVPFIDDLREDAIAAGFKYIFDTDGRILYNEFVDGKEVEEYTGVNYRYHSNSFSVIIDSVEMNKVTHEHDPQAPSMPVNFKVWVNVPFDSNSSVIAPLADADGTIFGAELV